MAFDSQLTEQANKGKLTAAKRFDFCKAKEKKKEEKKKEQELSQESLYSALATHFAPFLVIFATVILPLPLTALVLARPILTGRLVLVNMVR